MILTGFLSSSSFGIPLSKGTTSVLTPSVGDPFFGDSSSVGTSTISDTGEAVGVFEADPILLVGDLEGVADGTEVVGASESAVGVVDGAVEVGKEIAVGETVGAEISIVVGMSLGEVLGVAVIGTAVGESLGPAVGAIVG